MTDETPKTYQILAGNVDAVKAIDSVIARATSHIVIFDHTLQDRGYNSPARYEVLRALFLAQRTARMRIVLHDTQGIEAHCPRLMMLLKQFSAAIQIHRSVGVARDAHDPFVIADDAHYWHKLHYQHPRSVLTLDSAADTKPLLDRFEEIWESSEHAVSATSLGL